jgi:SAM-dependent methyltransferase
MRDDVTDIAAYYNRSLEGEHARLESHQLEHDLTWRYLERYLPKRGSILEVGAATGRYTLGLAKRGHAVTAVDMSEKLLDKCRHDITAAGLIKRVKFVLADVRDLTQVMENKFAAVLLMGPLYHLVYESDRKLALQQAWERLREGGILFSTFICRYGLFSELLKNDPEWITDRKDVRSVLSVGRDPDDHPRGGFRGYFAQASELAPLHESVGFETLVVAASEPIIAADDESYNKLQGRQRKLWLDILFEMSTQESLLGASRHLIYIGRKN